MDGYLAVPASRMAFSDILFALLMYFADEKKDYCPGRASAPSGSNLTLESRMGFPSDLPNVVVGFQAAISRFVAEANDDPKPFTWLADPNKSIVAVRRGYQVLDSIH